MRRRPSDLNLIIKYFLDNRSRHSTADNRKKHINKLDALMSYYRKPLVEITEKDLLEWFNLVKIKGYQYSTLLNYYTVYRQFFKYLHNNKTISINPMNNIERPIADEMAPQMLPSEKAGKRKKTSNLRLIVEYILDYESSLAVTTQQKHISILKNFMQYCSKYLTEITDVDIVGWFTVLKERGNKNSSLLEHYEVLKHFYSYLQENQKIRQNPIHNIKKPNYEAPLLKILTPRELNLLQEETEICYRDSAIIQTLFFTGVRVSELAEIKIYDINFDRREIKIFGKNDKIRLVYFTAICKQKIERYLAYRKDNCEFLFKSFKSNFNRPLSALAIRKIVKKYVNKCNLSEDISPHTFRRSFAVHLWDKGFTLEEIAVIMGHESIEVTKRYIPLSPIQLKVSYDKYY